jgi:aspartate kinase
MYKPVVIKLGGTSQCITGYTQILKIASAVTTPLVIVLSAVSGVTNLLVNFVNTKVMDNIYSAIEKNRRLCADLKFSKSENEQMERKYSTLIDICNEYISAKGDTIEIQATIMGFGEVLSTEILLLFFVSNGVKSISIDARGFVKTKKETYKLFPTCTFYGDYKAFNAVVDDAKIVITQGFIGSTPSGRRVLLGRGGSDTTGSIIAEMLDASEYQVWTDVDGIYTTDPRIIPTSKRIDEIEYSMVREIASMGAKVMHPLSILPCESKNIPIIVKNTFNMESIGTIIKRLDVSSPGRSENISFIAVRHNITLFKIESPEMTTGHGFVNEIFTKFTNHRIAVDIITTSTDEICTTTDDTNIADLHELNCELNDTYNAKMIENCAIVSIISPNVNKQLSKIDTNTIPMHIMHTSSNFKNLNFVVDDDKVTELVKHLYSVIMDF